MADLIAAELRDTWPDEVVALAGAWPDLPGAETLRAEMERLLGGWIRQTKG